MEIRVPHTLKPEDASARLRVAAERFDLSIPTDAGGSAENEGVLVKETPLGDVRARWQVSTSELVITVEERPGFLPENTIRRALEDNLKEILAG